MFSDDTQDVFSQPSDDGQSFVVFSEGFYEHKGGITSVISEFLSLSGDFSFSVINPDKVLVGGFDFSLQPFSVFSGFVSDSFILVGYGSELLDLSAEGFFLSSVDLVGSGLSIDVSLFQGVQKVESGINGVSSACLGIH